jgi:hypothetical protein
LRRIFGPKRYKVTGDWRKLHNEELHNMYSSPSIIRNIESRMMTWSGHVVRMGTKRNAYRILLEKATRKETTGKTNVSWWIILKWILERYEVVCIGLIRRTIATSGGLL